MLKMADALALQAMSPLECEEFVRGAIRCGLPLSRVEEYLDWLDLLHDTSADKFGTDEPD
jgi:hypothetical protein